MLPEVYDGMWFLKIILFVFLFVRNFDGAFGYVLCEMVNAHYANIVMGFYN